MARSRDCAMRYRRSFIMYSKLVASTSTVKNLCALPHSRRLRVPRVDSTLVQLLHCGHFTPAAPQG